MQSCLPHETCLKVLSDDKAPLARGDSSTPKGRDLGQKSLKYAVSILPPVAMPRIPRILHIGNTSNVAAGLRDALVAESLADGLVLETHNNRLNFDEDVRLSWDWISTPLGKFHRQVSAALVMGSLVAEADIIHVHHSGSLVLSLQKWARARGKPVVRHFHGVELRSGDVEDELRNADAVVVSTPDLVGKVPPWFPRERVAWIPSPYLFQPLMEKTTSSRPVRVVHAYLRDASYARSFGTELLRKAVGNLKEKGIHVVLDEVTGMTHEAALSRYALADIAVDKLRIGWHGVFAVECAALGIPVLAQIRPDLVAFEPPVIPVTEEGLEDMLESLVLDHEARRKAGRLVYERAVRLHGFSRIAHKMFALYSTMLN